MFIPLQRLKLIYAITPFTKACANLICKEEILD